jgi:hypothetical protein
MVFKTSQCIEWYFSGPNPVKQIADMILAGTLSQFLLSELRLISTLAI